MLSSTSVLGAALVSWNSNDGIVRLKSKKEQPPRPLINSSGLDPVSITKRRNIQKFNLKFLLLRESLMITVNLQ